MKTRTSSIFVFRSDLFYWWVHVKRSRLFSEHRTYQLWNNLFILFFLWRYGIILLKGKRDLKPRGNTKEKKTTKTRKLQQRHQLITKQKDIYKRQCSTRQHIRNPKQLFLLDLFLYIQPKKVKVRWIMKHIYQWN